jgi:hypothetical protein
VFLLCGELGEYGVVFFVLIIFHGTRIFILNILEHLEAPKLKMAAQFKMAAKI